MDRERKPFKKYDADFSEVINYKIERQHEEENQQNEEDKEGEDKNQ